MIAQNLSAVTSAPSGGRNLPQQSRVPVMVVTGSPVTVVDVKGAVHAHPIHRLVCRSSRSGGIEVAGFVETLFRFR